MLCTKMTNSAFKQDNINNNTDRAPALSVNQMRSRPLIYAPDVFIFIIGW